MSATKPVQEPPHASLWEFIRARCPEEKGRSCGFPWCNCPALKTVPLSTITNDGGVGVTTPSAPYPDERIERAAQ